MSNLDNDNNKYNVFIVDCYNLAYRSIEDEQVIKYKSEKIHTEGIIGFIKAMESYIARFGVKEDELKIYWLFDNAKTSIQKYRKSLSEDYKKTRVPAPEWFYKQLDMLELILKSYRDNSYLFRVKFLEADDYVSNVISSYLNKDSDRVLLISEDSDWFRSLDTNVQQYAHGKIYNRETFFEEYGFEATYSNICMYKSIYGDKTDCILGAIPQLPKMLFLKILESNSSIYDILQNVKNNNSNYLDLSWKARFLKEEEKLILNWNLVEAVEISNSELESFQVKCKFQEDRLRIIYSALQLLGKIDIKRFPYENKDLDIFGSMLEGININRKKV